MKKRYFLLSALAAAAIAPGTASANLVLDMPPILAGQNENQCAQYTGCPTGPCYPGCNNPCVQCNTTCQNFTGCPTGPCYPNCTDPCDSTTCSSSSSALNDTGITVKELDHDDSQYGRDADTNLTKTGSGHAGFDFTKLNSSGTDLAADATTWECVRDNVTGIVWSKDQGTSDLAGITTKKNAADNANSGSGLCGKKGWREPNLRELLSLVSYGAASYNAGKTIDSTFFPDTQAGLASSNSIFWYWTATSTSLGKWGVSFQPKSTSNNTVQYVHSISNSLTGTHYLRLVNGTELKGSFTPDDTNGTVTDENAGLIWKRCLEGQTWSGTACTDTATPYTWASALSLTVNGWRLPNIKELQSSTEYFVTNGSEGFIWSSSPYAGNTNNIWVLNISSNNTSNGTFFNGMAKTANNGYVRLVKDVQ